MYLYLYHLYLCYHTCTQVKNIWLAMGGHMYLYLYLYLYLYHLYLCYHTCNQVKNIWLTMGDIFAN